MAVVIQDFFSAFPANVEKGEEIISPPTPILGLCVFAISLYFAL